MGGARKIPEAEWNVHKARLRSLYNTKDLREVMECLACEHGFEASKAQYILQFKKWGFKKYSNKDQWKAIAIKVRKRKSQGKESEICVRGEKISDQKARKEMSRYAPPTFDPESRAREVETMDDLIVRTPQGELVRPIKYLHIPWFEFQTLVEPYFEHVRQMNAIGAPSFHAPHQPVAMGGTSMPLDSPLNTGLGHTTQQWDFLDNLADPQLGTPPSVEWNRHAAQNFGWLKNVDNSNATMVMTEESSGEVLSLLAHFVGASASSDRNEYQDVISSHLDDLTIEMYDGQIVENVQKLQMSSKLDKAFQLIRYSIYLSSNNLLSEAKTDRLVEWIAKSGTQYFLDHLFDLNIPTTKVFCSNVFVSAARLGHIEIVRGLISRGVEVNTLAGDAWRRTALQEAVLKHHVPIVRLLLEAGADPKTQVGCRCSILRSALLGPNSHELVQMLLDRGVDVNEVHKNFIGEDTVLVSAAENSDHAMIKILLKAGADVNIGCKTSASALQEAALRDDPNIAQSLIDAGADIDAPTSEALGSIYEAAEAAEAVEDDEDDEDDEDYDYIFDLFTTPIQRASLDDNTEVVQILLNEGADVDACPLERYLESKDHCNIKTLYRYKQDLTALQAAVENGNAYLVRILLMADADINAPGHGATALQIASANNDVKMVQLLLQQGADVNAPADEYEATALQAATMGGNRELIQHLIDAGADVNAVGASTRGRTALQAAVLGGHVEVVRLLIQRGANINADASPKGGRTCLQTAAEEGHAEIMSLLLKQGANVNSPAAAICDGRTAIQAALLLLGRHFSLKKSCLESREHYRNSILQILLDAGADLNSPSSPKKGISTLAAAVQTGDPNLVRSLIQRGLDPVRHTGRDSGVLEAVVKQSPELLSLLVEAGADVNGCSHLHDTSSVKGTALQQAASIGNMPMVRMLLDAGAQVNLQTHRRSRWTPLICAVEIGCLSIVHLLLARGADPNAGAIRDHHTFTALEQALSEYDINLQIVSALVNAGADVNGNSDGSPPLIEAAASGNVEAVQLLLDCGASTVLRSHSKGSVLQTATRTGDIEIINILLDAGVDVNDPAAPDSCGTALQMAVKYGSIEIVKLLASYGADVNDPAAPDSCGTALQMAVEYDYIEIVKLLASYGADVNAPAGPYSGRTALQGATERGYTEIVKLLLSHGADVNAPSWAHSGRTALQGATERGYTEIVKLLLSHGADVNAPAGDSHGITALQGAAIGGHLKIALLLLKAGAEVNAPPARINGREALEAAAEHGRLDIVHLLLENDDDDDTEATQLRYDRAAEYALSNGHTVIAEIIRARKAARTSMNQAGFY